jgi:hypothetical protein
MGANTAFGADAAPTEADASRVLRYPLEMWGLFPICIHAVPRRCAGGGVIR